MEWQFATNKHYLIGCQMCEVLSLFVSVCVCVRCVRMWLRLCHRQRVDGFFSLLFFYMWHSVNDSRQKFKRLKWVTHESIIHFKSIKEKRKKNVYNRSMNGNVEPEQRIRMETTTTTTTTAAAHFFLSLEHFYIYASFRNLNYESRNVEKRAKRAKR